MQRDMVVYCPKCQGYRHFNYLAETVQVDDKAGPPARYSFGFCPQCRGPFIMVQEQYGGATFDDDKGVQVYPPNKRRLSFKVPAVVEASYLEAVRCEGNQAWIATAAMVGRTLEAVCKDEEPKSKSMFEGLQKLRKAGKISDELWQWADQLRVLRNQGAHASEEAIEREDAVDALNFLQAILETLYHLRPMFQEMRPDAPRRAPRCPSRRRVQNSRACNPHQLHCPQVNAQTRHAVTLDSEFESMASDG